jgi:hypothetical protein
VETSIDITFSSNSTSGSLFYRSITNVIQGLNIDWPQEILVRKDYLELWRIIEQKKADTTERLSFLLTGNPGIGKTCFLLFIIYHLAMHGSTKLFYSNTAEQRYCYIDFAGKRMFHSREELSLVSAVLDKGVDYYCYDCSPSCGMLDMDVVRNCPITIMVSSPNELNYKQAYKKLNSSLTVFSELYMSVWELDELRAVTAKIERMKECELLEKYRIYGGCARAIFRRNEYIQDLDSVIATTNCHKLYSIVCHYSTSPLGKDYKFSHRICRVCPTSDYSGYTVDFLSTYIKDKVLETLMKQSYNDLVDLINSLKGITLGCGIRSGLFERYLHDALMSNRTFKIKD